MVCVIVSSFGATKNGEHMSRVHFFNTTKNTVKTQKRCDVLCFYKIFLSLLYTKHTLAKH